MPQHQIGSRKAGTSGSHRSIGRDNQDACRVASEVWKEPKGELSERTDPNVVELCYKRSSSKRGESGGLHVTGIRRPLPMWQGKICYRRRAALGDYLLLSFLSASHRVGQNDRAYFRARPIHFS